MSQVRITCIDKNGGPHSNPNEAISHYGWINSSGKRDKSSRAIMVKWMESGNKAYVEDNLGNRAYCHVRTSVNRIKFLQTVSDGKYTNNLLNLPKC